MADQRPSEAPYPSPPPAPARPDDSVSGLLADLVHAPEVNLISGLGSHLVSGARIGRFVIAHELGRGRGGTIYEALDLEREKPVALKLLSPGPSGTPRGAVWAHREAADFRRLDHPNIVALRGAGRSGCGWRTDRSTSTARSGSPPTSARPWPTRTRSAWSTAA
jgi:hypothetical protein